MSVDLISDKSSYPGGKSGSGIYQRLINLIPPHRVLVVPFAGHCGVVRNIRPAEHTIVIDQDSNVCEWWDAWRRSKKGRALEIHHCDGIEWLRYRFGVTEYIAKACDAGSADVRSHDSGSRCRKASPEKSAAGDGTESQTIAASAGDDLPSDAAVTRSSAAEYFVFCDPPYVLSERVSGRCYEFELSDSDHERFVSVANAIAQSSRHILVCGYRSDLYATLERRGVWYSIDHRVPTRGGLQDERIWMNYYPKRTTLHDYRYLGDCRRDRERIRRRQTNWLSQLNAMSDRERTAMIQYLTGGNINDETR